MVFWLIVIAVGLILIIISTIKGKIECYYSDNDTIMYSAGIVFVFVGICVILVCLFDKRGFLEKYKMAQAGKYLIIPTKINKEISATKAWQGTIFSFYNDCELEYISVDKTNLKEVLPE